MGMSLAKYVAKGLREAGCPEGLNAIMIQQMFLEHGPDLKATLVKRGIEASSNEERLKAIGYNLGNVKARGDEPFLPVIETKEFVDGRWVVKKGAKFREFSSIEEYYKKAAKPRFFDEDDNHLDTILHALSHWATAPAYLPRIIFEVQRKNGLAKSAHGPWKELLQFVRTGVVPKVWVVASCRDIVLGASPGKIVNQLKEDWSPRLAKKASGES